MARIRHGCLVCDLGSHVDMNSTASCSHRLSTTMSIFPNIRDVNSMRSRLPTLRTNTADLMSSFVSANEMQEQHLIFKATAIIAASLILGNKYIADITNWDR